VRNTLRAADSLPARAAARLLAWSAGHVAPAHRAWVSALAGELEVIEGGPARLRWALGGLSLVHNDWRNTMSSRTWPSWPDLLRTCVFGLALGAVLMVGIVWSNVIVPSHESDSEYTTWYGVFYLSLLFYFGLAGAVASMGRGSLAHSALAGAATAVISLGLALVTFVVIDNLFLDIVMTQPDKVAGFRQSGMSSQRDYVNQGLWAASIVLIFVGGVGAGCGLAGGSLYRRLRRPRPQVA